MTDEPELKPDTFKDAPKHFQLHRLYGGGYGLACTGWSKVGVQYTRTDVSEAAIDKARNDALSAAQQHRNQLFKYVDDELRQTAYSLIYETDHRDKHHRYECEKVAEVLDSEADKIGLFAKLLKNTSAHGALAKARNDALEEAVKSVFGRIGDIIEDSTPDGLTTSGCFSEHVLAQQSTHIKGVRSGRLFAINAIRALKTKEGE